jgi:hypothetical protein
MNKATKCGNYRSRARKYGCDYEPINRAAVFARDGFMCGLCGKKTLRRAKHPHPRSPTLDHIVPLSKGGSHSYGNVQCACFDCNSRKCAGAGGQTILPGFGRPEVHRNPLAQRRRTSPETGKEQPGRLSL